MIKPFRFALVGLFLATSTGFCVDLQVVGTTPSRNTAAPITTTITIDFDHALNPATIDANSFRVFGRWSGAPGGTFSFANGDQRLVFTPTRSFSAGEAVFVNLSHDIAAMDGSPMRSAGYAFQFRTSVAASGTIELQELDVISNLEGDPQTRIYGAAAVDLNEDGYLDLATVNEVSADIRVALNLADGTGNFGSFLTPEPIGVEASPNESADFNNDGHIDLCISATATENVWILLGNGDGTFGSSQSIAVGSVPHGIAVLDVDGDADMDIVNANLVSDDLSLMINDGTGTFGAPTFFDSGVSSEYGVVGADMNDDGITDILVAGRSSQQLVAMLGNGDGTFTASTPQSTGGQTWVVVVGDVDGDGTLDAATANSFSNNGGIVIGNGDGTFAPPVTVNVGAHVPSADLGDLDGDGDLDLVMSSFGGSLWRLFSNDGAGSFTFTQDIVAPSNPSCAVLFDFDNDLDLDMGLTDEIADVVVLMENVANASSVVDPAHSGALFVLPNAPNPFGEATLVRYYLASEQDPTIDVFDVLGRRLATHASLPGAPGWTQVTLPALDAAGNPLANGVYFYRVRAGGESVTGRMVVRR